MRLAGVIWLAGALVYFLAEYTAAGAFTPSYSIAHNFISDLGVPECGIVFQGRAICSPQHGLMNAAFAIEGLSFFAGAMLLSRVSEIPNARFPISAALFAVGMMCIASFHGSTAAEASDTFVLHVLGALVAIVSSNVAILASRNAARGARLSQHHRNASLALSIISSFAFFTLAVAQTLNVQIVVGPGIWERAILYPVLLWQFATGFCLLFQWHGVHRAVGS